MPKPRKAKDGNVIWEYYRESGETRQEQLEEFLRLNNLSLFMWYSDTKKDTDLNNVPYKRMRLYMSFFTEIDFEQYLEPVIKTDSMKQQEADQAEKKRLAQNQGLSLPVAAGEPALTRSKRRAESQLVSN